MGAFFDSPSILWARVKPLVWLVNMTGQCPLKCPSMSNIKDLESKIRLHALLFFIQDSSDAKLSDQSKITTFKKSCDWLDFVQIRFLNYYFIILCVGNMSYVLDAGCTKNIDGFENP